ncbi:hypothetical protein A0J61_04568 [Choanephora cucurbitarum]|uniref:Jacalin-type lectin domain-containing protein n=1 Tax=Choanephora cucurbitarum TaxID=101091 RepID=A0A1C7NE79_9FUNG|nr:hypothetical protein A0J61_04568 [Choanephora cucurbitarum]
MRFGHKAPTIPQRPNLSGIEINNVKEGETVYQRFLLINGRAGLRTGSFDKPIQVLCNDFPPTNWPCVDSYFKAMVHLIPGPNTITFVFEDTTLHFHVQYLPLLQKPPLSLVIMIGSDSPATFDVPPEKKEQNTLAIAIEKLRMAGYMWQAFCAEQMHRHGLGRRTFRLDEAWLPDTVSQQDKGIMRQTANVHVIRSKHTVREIRDKRRAQQSEHQDESFESLFDYFLEALHDNPPFDKPCYVAGLVLDSHWDGQVSLGHTALGGGAGDSRLGVFGSHLLHAWPVSVEDIVPSLLNNTITDTRFVANDANESGNWWRAANIGMGAMLHEVGHCFTLSHTPTGVMSRGYNNWNRTFVAKEPGLSPIPPEKEDGSHWHRADVMRLRFHPAFRLPQDGPCGPKNSFAPTIVPLDKERIQIVAPSGLSMVEMFVDGQYRTHLEFLQTQPTQIVVNYSDICTRCKCHSSQRISLEVTSTNQSQYTIDNLHQFLQEHVIRLPGIEGPVIKSNIFGGHSEGKAKSSVVFGNRQLVRIIVNHGCFLDGFALVWNDGSRHQVGLLGGGQSLFDVYPGEHIQSLLVRSGAWIDGIQFKLSSGRLSPWYGGEGGSLHVVEAPEGHGIVGFFGSANDWMVQIGIYSASARN